MDPEFQKRLLATYRLEAREHLEAMASAIEGAGKTSAAEERLGSLRRLYSETHSLKGAARSINASAAEALCHRMESLLSDLVAGRHHWEQAMEEVLDETVAFLMAWHEQEEALLLGPLSPEASVLLRKLSAFIGGAAEAPAARPEQAQELVRAEEPPSPPKNDVKPLAGTDGTLRASVARLDALYFQAEQMLLGREEGHHHSEELQKIGASLHGWKREWQPVQSDLHQVNKLLAGGQGSVALEGRQALLRLLRFVRANRDFLETVTREVDFLTASSQNQQAAMSNRLDLLLDLAKEILMQPLSSAFEGVGVFIRDAARREGKSLRFELEGGAMEVDRRILEEMKMPFLHLMRNALSHGIESPEDRRKVGKKEEGVIRVQAAARSDGKLTVTFADDGAGINLDRVRQEALRLGVVLAGQAEKMTEEELLSLLFRPEFSTQRAVTELSGRGLGLYIVADKAERLGGSVEVESEWGKGTRFTVVLPVSLARLRAVLVEAGGSKFFLPTGYVERVVRVRSVMAPHGAHAAAEVDGRAIPLVRLGSLLSLSAPEDMGDILEGVLVGSGDSAIILIVDGILGEQEILLKKLGKQLSRVRHIAGATMLGWGEIVPVLAVPDLQKTAAGGGGAAAAPLSRAKAAPAAVQRAILVVEDSMTARTLLKHIIEGAGYRVETASDGSEGLAKARAHRFDLVVSDVEMPRVNGFELTRALREDQATADVPVILLTALASREDREQGLEAGADAYIIKTSFDESNLLGTIEDLLGND